MLERSTHSGNDKRRGIEWRDVTPQDNKESVEKYVEKIPDIVVDEYKKYIDKHKEDDELVKRYPQDYHRSISVLPIVEEDGSRYLRTVSTDEGKTNDFLAFLKEGLFHFENEIIEGVKREEVEEELRRIVKEKDRKKEEMEEIK